jgi:predicted SAM-dependent methyltransferase
MGAERPSKTFGVNIVVGIPSFGMVSTYFMQGRMGQAMPLVSSAIDKFVIGKPIADARNEIVEFALSQGANYIYWLDDDVIPPPDAFLKMYKHRVDIINGVYWSKSNPPMPLLFRNHFEGPYWDWHVGDLIEIDAAGSGLTLVKTDVYRKIKEPWYSTDYASFPGVKSAPPNNTEDLYFYWKAREAGYKIWADTSIQAYHYDKVNGVMYSMPMNSPQANPAWEVKNKGGKLIADIGSGPISPYMMDEGEVVSFDIREDMKPDVVCDVRHLPVPDQTFDILFSSHTLEHFSWQSADKVLREWARVLKVGGELRLVVPNLRYVAKRLLDDTVIPSDYWVIYGEQDYPKNFHGIGFTPKTLASIVESLGIFEDIQIKEGNYLGQPAAENWNLQLKATKARHPEIDNITPDYIKAGPPEFNMWPVAIYPDSNTREMHEVEIAADKAKWLLSEEALAASESKRKVVSGAKDYEITSADRAIFGAPETIEPVTVQELVKPSRKKKGA